MSKQAFTRQFQHAIVSVDMDICKTGMIKIQQDTDIMCILPKDAEAFAKALLEADQYIKDQKI